MSYGQDVPIRAALAPTPGMFTQYELLLGKYCQTRDPQYYIDLTRSVMPALTMAQENNECARPFKILHPGQPTPMDDPRNPVYENYKRVNCYRWYYFDHESDAKRTLRERLAKDPECDIQRRIEPVEQILRAVPADRPTLLQWRGNAPPPLPMTPRGTPFGADDSELMGVGLALGIAAGIFVIGKVLRSDKI